jgi:hypothetical protein
MTTVNEFDAIRLLRPVKACVIGEEPTKVVMPAGSKGTVVHVHGPRAKPEAYEVEFILEPLKSYAIATVDADLVTTP